jgi:tetratricopeptide (TPR) repeat protein
VKNAASAESLAVLTNPVSEAKPDIARNFAAVEGTRLEIPFDGSGWTYLGEQTQKEGIAYDSRRFQGSSLVFVLNPTKTGDYVLRFQRQDSLRGLSYEELVGVTVAPKPAAQSSPSAPPASPGVVAAGPAVAVPASPVVGAMSPAVAAASPAALPASTAALPSPAPMPDPASLSTPEAALAAARSELGAGRPQGALVALDRLLALAPTGTDEAYLLYGRALEANGPQKDIKRAYAYYKKLRDDYPESPFWDEADARVSYIDRHYFDIR